jgi:hypothetical protein
MNRRVVPHPPGFLLSLLGSTNFMRLSLEKGAHAVLSSAAWQESGVLCALCKGWDTRRSVSRFVVSHPSQKARRMGHPAAFFKEGRMRFIDPTKPYGKSGGMGHPPICCSFAENIKPCSQLL